MRSLARWMSALVLSFLSAGPALAQLTTGGIRGSVRDPSGGMLPGVTVELTAPVLQGTRLEVTDIDGAFAFNALPPGDGYALTATLEGFRSVRADGIHVYLGRQGTIALTMQLAISEEIVVTAPAVPLIDVTSATTGVNVTAKQYDALPTRRTFQELTAMAPGVSLELGERRPELATSPSVAGATALENNYLIEGISTTEVMQGGSGTNVTMNFVEEIQVMTGAMSAEFGRSLGGIFNVVTKSGGNDVAGDVFAYYQSDDWSSTSVRRRFRETSSKANGIDSRDIGVAIGGPVRRDRLWFFAAWDPTRKTTYTRDFVDASGAFVDAEREFDLEADLFAGKLTWALSPRHQVVATAFGDPTTREGWLGLVKDDPTVALQRNVIGSVNYVARYDGWFRERASLEARIGTHRASDDLEATTEIGRTVPRQQDYTGARHGGSGYQREQPVSRESIFVKASAPWRNHRLTAGVDVQDSRVDAVASFSYFTFFGRRKVPGGIGPADEMRGWRSSYDGYGSVLGAAAFAQDDWDIVPGLRLSAGVRYERQTVDSAGGVMIAGVGGDGSLTEPRRAGDLALDHNWAPRLGVVWDPRRDGRGKLYVHAGRYFEALPAHAAYWGSGQTYELRRYYSRVAHDPSTWYNPTGSPLKEEWVEFAAAGEGVDETAAAFDPEVRMQYQDELRAGGEIQLGHAWSAGAHYVHRRIGRVLDDVGLFLDPADPLRQTGWLITNPGEGKLGSPYSDPKRDYDSVELTVQRRPSSGHWYLQSSFVWARAEGDYDGLYRSNNNQVGANLTTYYDHPTVQTNAYGPLMADRPYQVKAFGSYDFPFGLALGGAFMLTAGSPVSALGPVGTLDYEFFLKPRGSEGRTPAYWTLDLHADHELPLASGALSLIVDVFNATDNHEAIMVDQAYAYWAMPGFDAWLERAEVDEYGVTLWSPDLPVSPYFKTPILYQSPRTMQVGVKYRF